MIPGIVAAQLSASLGPGDPLWSQVVSLLHFDGTTGSTSIIDETGRAWSASGDAQLSTVKKVFGPSSLMLDSIGDYISTAHDSVLSVGTGDLTIEAFVYLATKNRVQNIVNKRPSGGGAEEFSLYVDSDNTLSLACFLSGSAIVDLVSSTPLDTGIWYHVAATREGLTWRIFIDGVLEGTQNQTATPGTSSSPMLIGRDAFTTSRDWAGWIDEFRYTKGTARYTATFTPPTSPFPNHS